MPENQAVDLFIGFDYIAMNVFWRETPERSQKSSGNLKDDFIVFFAPVAHFATYSQFKLIIGL